MHHASTPLFSLKKISICIAMILLIVPILVLVGWAENIVILKSIFPGIVSMNPHTALCFMLAGISLLLIIFGKKPWVRYVVAVLGLFIITFGAVRMLGILGIVDLHLDQVLFHDKLMQVTAFSNNRIAPNTAFNLILLGSMLIALAYGKFLRTIQASASVMFLIALLAIVGYLYEVHNLYGFLSYTPMALNAALCFCLASLAILIMLPQGYMLDVIISDTPGGLISRRLMPTIIVIPLILGLSIVHGIEKGYYDANYAIALFTVALIGVFLLVLITVIYRINRIDAELVAAREEAEASRMRAETAKDTLHIKLQESEKQNAFLEDSKRAMLNLVEDLDATKKDLESQKKKDEALLESIGDAVFAVDEKGLIILFNPVAESLSGVSAQDALGKHYKKVLTFVREDTGKENYTFVEKSLGGTKASMENHTLLISADGRRTPVADSASPIVDNDGTISGSVVVFRDVTHEYQVDKAKTEFVSLASHQLRTPLSAIGWYTELLADGDAGKITKKQKEFLAQIAESNARMVDLVNSLLNVSRIDMGTLASDPVSLDVTNLSSSVLAELAPQIKEHKIVIREEVEQHPLDFIADPQLMRIIIQNLLSNAVKYTPEKGTVTLSIHIDDQLFHLSVSDTGYGIPEAQQPKIFTKLFRADNAKEKVTDGNGLGLYVVKSVVEEHGGKIWFTSKEDEGTTFFVELPAFGMKKIEGSKTLS